MTPERLEHATSRRNIRILTAAQSLGGANAPIVISLGGLVGQKLSSNPALILLGIGWNFGFLGATAMVADCHSPEERAKVQGTKDFIVFGTVATASFFAGSLLHSSGWATINRVVLPVSALVLVPLVWRASTSRP